MFQQLTAFVLFAATAAWAQQQGNTGVTNPAGNNTPSGRTQQPVTQPADNPLNQRPIFISGSVTLPDGSPPPNSAKIERVCDANTRVEGNTDRKGHFAFELGRNMEIPDASVGNFDPVGMGGGSRNGLGGLANADSNSNLGRSSDSRSGLGRQQLLWGCELRASLGGFRSSIIQLSTIHDDQTDVGTIILMPMGKVDGLTVSATLALAPKDARKAYEKGLDAVKKKNAADAQANFEKATSLYPKHSAAWFELGKLAEVRNQDEEAIKAYEQSITADSKFVAPYVRVAWMQLKKSQWDQLAETSAHVIRLNPYEFPEAFYLHSIAQLQLSKWDESEKDAREALKLDINKRYQRAHYVLGLALAQKQDFAGAAQSFRNFLAAEPNANDASQIRGQLEQVEAAFRQKDQSKN